MVMSFAEILVFAAVAAAFYFALRPLQRWIAARMMKALRKTSHDHVVLLPTHFNSRHKDEEKE